MPVSGSRIKKTKTVDEALHAAVQDHSERNSIGDLYEAGHLLQLADKFKQMSDQIQLSPEFRAQMTTAYMNLAARAADLSARYLESVQ